MPAKNDSLEVIMEAVETLEFESADELAGRLRAIIVARPIAEWHEDRGPALWWRFPIDEPPFSGSPRDSDWPGYHTHWTPIVCPLDPSGEG